MCWYFVVRLDHDLLRRVVVNELTVWKDAVTTKLHETQQTLKQFEEHSKRIYYTLHQADRYYIRARIVMIQYYVMSILSSVHAV